jgi:dihydrofolate reductase
MAEACEDTPPTILPGSVNIIVVCDENRAIGRGGRLPWRIREDWRWFLGRTNGGACVIGRISFEAMRKGGNVNDKRRFFVVSRDPSLAGPNAQVFPDSFGALESAKATGLPVWICGGPRIYAETMPFADRLYLTQIHAKIEGCDAWMPDWNGEFSAEPIFIREGSDEVFRYTFTVLERKTACGIPRS